MITVHAFRNKNRVTFKEWLQKPKNLKDLMAAPPLVREKAKGKFLRFYPNGTWPLDDTPEESAPAPAIPAMPKAEDPDPKVESFTCLRYKGYQILKGDVVVTFVDGHYSTSDPEKIQLILDDPYFNLFIIAENPDLRAQREWKR